MKLLYFLFIYCRSPLNRYYKQVFFLRGLHQLNLLKLLRVLRQKPDTHFVYKLDHRGFQTTYLIQRLTSRIQWLENWMHFVYKLDRLIQNTRVSDENSSVTKTFHFSKLISTQDFFCIQHATFKAIY